MPLYETQKQTPDLQDAPSSEQSNEKESFKTFVWETLKIIIICLVIVVPLKKFVIQPFYVKGASMEPNFHDHEYLVIDEISYRFNDPVRGDIIVFHYPSGKNSYYIKRVIGLPGERIIINNDKVIIHNQENEEGFVLDESQYLPLESSSYNQVDLVLESDEYFVMGDNRPSSLDSRKIGPIKAQDIVGRTWLRIFPFDKISSFNGPQYLN